MEIKYQSLSRQTSHEIPYQIQQPMTPPVSAGLDDGRDRSMSMQMQMNGQQQAMPMSTTPMSNGDMGWNPTKIFEYVFPTSFLCSLADS